MPTKASPSELLNTLALKRGDLGSSFAFSVVSDEWRNNGQTRFAIS